MLTVSMSESVWYRNVVADLSISGELVGFFLVFGKLL